MNTEEEREKTMESTLSPGRNAAVAVLSQAECLELLGATGIGRIAFSTATGPRIYPVNYLVADGCVVVRTSPYAQLGEHASGLVAFEADHLDAKLRRGWSVLVVGLSAPVEDADEAIRLHHTGQLEPWAPGQRNLFVRITPREITGRRFNGC
jgi:nitroimidazol reductase NimA-like FMN-containing flavoprotein (pyridoxamine 5'-phosphate oxidase superfamily)